MRDTSINGNNISGKSDFLVQGECCSWSQNTYHLWAALHDNNSISRFTDLLYSVEYYHSCPRRLINNSCDFELTRLITVFQWSIEQRSQSPAIDSANSCEELAQAEHCWRKPIADVSWYASRKAVTFYVCFRQYNKIKRISARKLPNALWRQIWQDAGNGPHPEGRVRKFQTSVQGFFQGVRKTVPKVLVFGLKKCSTKTFYNGEAHQ